jgi:hypothetical protein
VRLTLRQLRQVIREALVREWAGTAPTKPMFNAVNEPLSPSTNDREQLGCLADTPPDVDPNDELPSHLRDPVEEPEDCYGPVPPVQGDPYVQQDPFTRDTSPLPTSPIRR